MTLKCETKKIQTKPKENLSESSEDAENQASVIYEDESSICVGCKEEYSQTKKKEDWIECTTCKRWLHEGCTKFLNMCNICGKKNCLFSLLTVFVKYY